MKDLPAIIHKAVFGKSDKANALENQGEEFQTGFAIGKENLPEYITAEYWRRGQPDEGSQEFARFREWKRGFWAGRIQQSVIKAYFRK